MASDQNAVMTVIKETGCLDFTRKRGSLALARIKQSQPEGFAYLDDDAVECLLNNYRERMDLIYSQVVTEQIRKKLEKHDPVGAMLGRFRPEPVRSAVQDLMAQTQGHLEDWLHTQYPLLDVYRKQIFDNYVSCFCEFLQAFLSVKDVISEKLLGAGKINRIMHLSTQGADIHRNGRCVIGVTTDAGTVYYKPHDCGLDALYNVIVGKWFSDCTAAADVVEGEQGGNAFAFVSCLKHEPLSSENDIAEYYYNFGIISALFHGLGTTDMHQENIISCREKPAAVDMETILGTAVHADEETGSMENLKVQQEINDSLIRTCLLPSRTYKGPLVSPLYTCSNNARCLPVYEGQFKTVEGHETDFIRGFREGYGRMLAHRDEIISLISSYKHATVRCLLRNTSFYYLIRQMLFRPEYLSDETIREKVYAKLCSPFTIYGQEPDRNTTQYEWQCILKGDIPYYCTTAAGKDLCGEDPRQIITKDYYQESVQDSAVRFLSRLSAQEEAFEVELIRASFDHAPTDEEKDKEPEPVLSDTVNAEKLGQEAALIFRDLKKDAVRCSDGSMIWMSTAQSLDMTATCGNAAVFGDVGMYSCLIASSAMQPELCDDAAGLTRKMCMNIARIMEQLEQLGSKADKLNTVFSPGLYAGFGGVILACRKMALAGFEEAFGLTDRIVRFVLDRGLYRYKKTDAAQGAAGLILALSALEQTKDVKELTKAAAQRLLDEELPDRADLPYGCAGIGAAFAAAYEMCSDLRFLQGLSGAFQKVMDEYKPELSGWPDAGVSLKWMADRGPHAAGIYLAAEYAKEKIMSRQQNTDPLPERISAAALESMLSETSLLHSDTLDQGNALTVLALLKAGKKTQAGQILSSMIKRKERKGCFTVTPPRIRSAFDFSFYMGTTGTGYAVMEYLKNE